MSAFPSHSVVQGNWKVFLCTLNTPQSPLRLYYSWVLSPSLFATKYRLLSHLWEWFCSLNITISSFSWPTETSPLTLMPPAPSSIPIHTPNLTLLLPSWYEHQQPQPPERAAIWVLVGFCTSRDLGPGERRVRGTEGFVNLWSRSPTLVPRSPLHCLVFIGLSFLPGQQQKLGEWIYIPQITVSICSTNQLTADNWEDFSFA